MAPLPARCPAEIRKRYDDLCRLAARPGTPGEGRAARRAARRLARKWPELSGRDRTTRGRAESVEREENAEQAHVVAVTCWIDAFATKIARSEPLHSGGVLRAVRVVGGTGFEAERERLIAADVGLEHEVLAGHVLRTAFVAGDVVFVRVRSRWPRMSRVSVHLEFWSEAAPVFVLGA